MKLLYAPVLGLLIGIRANSGMEKESTLEHDLQKQYAWYLAKTHQNQNCPKTVVDNLIQVESVASWHKRFETPNMKYNNAWPIHEKLNAWYRKQCVLEEKGKASIKLINILMPVSYAPINTSRKDNMLEQETLLKFLLLDLKEELNKFIEHTHQNILKEFELYELYRLNFFDNKKSTIDYKHALIRSCNRMQDIHRPIGRQVVKPLSWQELRHLPKGIQDILGIYEEIAIHPVITSFSLKEARTRARDCFGKITSAQKEALEKRK